MKILLPILLLISSHLSQSQNAIDSLEVELKELATHINIPGFGVAIVSKEDIHYTGGFGAANIKDGYRFTDSTIINIGSTTKTFIAVALMKLVEDNKINLDDPINQFLPFQIYHPSQKNISITIRQLATHTSGLTDGKNDMLIEQTYLFEGPINFKKNELPKGYHKLFKIYNSNRKLSIEQFLKNAYTEKGKWYSQHNFTNSPPGSEYRYSNLGATLLAYIIEQVSGLRFSDYVNQNILSPLAMRNSYWQLVQIPKKQLSSLYLSNGLEIPHYELITYPDGGLFTCVQDFSIYLQDMIKGLEDEGKILSPDSYREMLKNQLTKEYFPQGIFDSTKGLLWNVNAEGDNISMNGSDPGILSWTLFTTKGNAGIAIFLNTNLDGIEEREKDFNKIRGIIFKYIGSILKL